MAQILQGKGYTRVRALLGGWNAWLEARGAVEQAGMTNTPETQETPRAAPPTNAAAPKAQDAPAKKTTKSRTKRRRART